MVHAAGSGTGNLVAQVAANVFKCKVVGTCSEAKVGNVPLPSDQIVTSYTDVARMLAPIGGKRGFDVVIDGVGKDTFQASLDSCKPRGLVCLFGNASGPAPPIDPLRDLSANGSLFVTRPNLGNYVATHDELLWRAKDMFNWLNEGVIKIGEPKVFTGLESANEALEFVKQRKATNKVAIKI